MNAVSTFPVDSGKLRFEAEAILKEIVQKNWHIFKLDKVVAEQILRSQQGDVCLVEREIQRGESIGRGREIGVEAGRRPSVDGWKIGLGGAY